MIHRPDPEPPVRLLGLLLQFVPMATWRFSPAEEGGSQPWFMTSSSLVVGCQQNVGSDCRPIPQPWKMVESDDIPNELK